MAGDAVVGALRVVLGMDTASFEDSTKKAASATESFGKQVATIAAGIGLEKFVEASVKGLINFAKEAANVADAMYKMSQRTGVPVEELGGLKLAAELSEVSVEQLAKGFKNLQIDINKAASSGITPAASAFQFLGISINELKKDLPQEQFLKVVDALSKVEDTTNRTALAAAVFGKRFGPEMMPFILQGRKGIEEAAESARKLGLVFSEQTGKNAEEFNDRMKEVGSVVMGVSIQAFAPFSAQLAENAKKLADWIKESGLVQKAAEVLVRSIKFVSDNLVILNYVLGIFVARLVIGAIVSFGTTLATLAVQIGKVAAALLIMNTRLLLTAASIGILVVGTLLLTGQLDPFLKTLEDIATKLTLDKAINSAIDSMKAAGIETSSLTKGLKELGFEVDKFGRVQINKGLKVFDPEEAKKLQEFKQELAKLGYQAREVSGEFAGTLAPGFYQAAVAAKVIKEDGSNLEKVLTLGDEKARLLNEALIILGQNRLAQEFQTPWETYLETLQKIELQLGKAPNMASTFAQANIKAATTVATAYGQAAVTIASGFADAFKYIAEKNKQYAPIAKALAIATAIANTFVAANKAMAETPGGLPFQIAAAAAVTAAGLANVAKISATEFASGGRFKVGGAGGIDSQLISFKATPGEMVDVRKPGATGPSSEITIRGMSGREFFTGDMLRDLVNGLNAAHSDGYKLKFAE